MSKSLDISNAIINVVQKIREGDKERLQAYEGVVIALNGGGITSSPAASRTSRSGTTAIRSVVCNTGGSTRKLLTDNTTLRFLPSARSAVSVTPAKFSPLSDTSAWS